MHGTTVFAGGRGASLFAREPASLRPLPAESAGRRGVAGDQCRRSASQELNVPTASERYTLTAKELMEQQVELNGSELKPGSNGDLPQLFLRAGRNRPGRLCVAPASITFLANPDAGNANCR